MKKIYLLLPLLLLACEPPQKCPDNSAIFAENAKITAENAKMKSEIDGFKTELSTLRADNLSQNSLKNDSLKKENLDLERSFVERKSQLEKLNQEKANMEHTLATNGKEFIYILDLKVKTTSYTLNPMTHLRDMANAYTFSIPVDKDYWDQCREGEAISSSFKVGTLLTKGRFGNSSVTIVRKYQEKI